MAIFNKPTGDRPALRHEPSAAEPSISVIGTGMRIVGDIESNGVIKVEGVVQGSVRGARQLLLGKGGTIHGDVFATDIVLGGTVVGNVVASERVEVQGTSSVEGDIHTKSMVVYEGGTINGAVRMGEQQEFVAPPPRGPEALETAPES